MTEHAPSQSDRTTSAPNSRGPVPMPEPGRKWTRGPDRQVAALLARLGVRRRERPKFGKGGACEIGSDSFRKACAILEDGTVCFVRAYHTAEIATELALLRSRYDLPPETDRRAVSLEEMQALHGARPPRW